MESKKTSKMKKGSKAGPTIVVVLLCTLIAVAVFGIWLVKDKANTYKIMRPTLISMVEGTQPKTAAEYVNRAKTYLRWKETDKALADVNKALTLNRYDANAYAVRGSIYFMKEEYPRAVENFNIAISLNSEDPICFAESADSLYAVGQYLKALDNFNVSVSMKTLIKPKHRSTYLQHALWGRGKTYAMLGNPVLAGRDFTKVELLEKGQDPDAVPAPGPSIEDVNIAETAKLPTDPVLLALQKQELARFETDKQPPVLIFTTRELEAGEKIPAAILEQGVFVDETVPQGSIVSRKSIVGRIAKRKIPAGSRLTVSDITQGESGSK